MNPVQRHASARILSAAGLALVLLAGAALRAAAAPPTIQCPTSVSMPEGSAFQTTITASDPDNDLVTLRCVNPPFRARFYPTTGQFAWMPSFTQAGTYDILFQAIAAGETTGCTTHVTVTNFDFAPVPNCPQAQVVGLTSTLALTLTGTDVDQDSLTWSSPSLPVGATLNPHGQFQWQTNHATLGTYHIELDLSDGTISVPCDLAVTIVGVNAPPVVECPGNAAGDVGTTILFTVFGVSPLGGPVSLEATGVPANATFNPSAGVFRWSPQAGQAGVYQVTFSAVDLQNRRTSCLTTLNVGSIPIQAPVFTACPGPTVSGNELLAMNFQITAVDPQNLLLVYAAQGLPVGATFDAATRAFHWLPIAGQAGEYDVAFTATNGVKTSTCPVHLSIAAVQRPQFTGCPGNLSAAEQEIVRFQVVAVDPNGFTLTYSAENLPTGSTFSPGTSTFAWLPVIGQAGTYDFSFKATSIAGVATCSVHLVVTATSPGTPTIQCPGAQQVVELQTLSFPIVATDPQNRPLTLALTNPPLGATFASGLFTWRPSLVQAGGYTLHFTISNGFFGASCDAPVTVTNRPNAAPVLACPGAITTSLNRAIAFDVPATDANGDPLQYFAHNLPPGASYTAGHFAWSPGGTGAGTYTTTFLATDTELTDSCVVAIDVLPHTGAVGSTEPMIGHVRDVRPDQGGWVRVTLVAAPADAGGGVISGYGLWRRIEGPAAHALAHPAASPTAVGGAHAGAIVPAAEATALGFPPGTWESVAFVPSLQSLDAIAVVPTRDDSSAAGRPYEVFVPTTHFLQSSSWTAGAPDSGYSVDDLPPRLPGAPAAQAVAGGVRVSWSASPDADLDHYDVLRGATADAPQGALVPLGATRDTAFVDASPVADAWYRVQAVDVHGNASLSAAAAGPRAPAWGVGGVLLSAPRPNPSRGETAFDLSLPAAGPVTVEIVDARGARVRVLQAGPLAAGFHALVWNGRSDAGRAVASGLYHLRVRAAGVALVRKIVLLR